MHLNLQEGGTMMNSGMINIVDNSKYAAKGYKNKFYRTNGMGFEDYFTRDLRKNFRKETTALLYSHVVWFYGRVSNSGKVYKYSNKGLCKFFEERMNNKDLSTIKRAWNTIEELRLITRRINDSGLRETFYDEELAYKLFNIYEPGHDKFLGEYANEIATKNIMDGCTVLTPKEREQMNSYELRLHDRLASRYGNLTENELQEAYERLVEKYTKALLKIVSKRFLSYVEHAQEKCTEYKEGKIENSKYSNANEMLIYFIHDVAGQYSDVSKLFEKFTPRNLKDEQDQIDDELLLAKKPMKRLSKEDIVRIKTMAVPKAKKYVKSLIGWYIPEGYESQAKSAGILFTEDGIIWGFDYFLRSYKW